MKQSATLVFDIGKTTKKVLLFDTHSNVLEEVTEHFTETKDDEGFPSENLPMLSRWVKEMLERFINYELFEVTHINFSAYGASLVHLDKQDQTILPFYNYLKPFGEELKKKFLSTYAVDQNVMANTASPFLGLLNSGLQLYWLKQNKPKVFNTITTTLHFPQYFPFLLTGKKFSELTSIGCHTMLWDFNTMTYHKWVTKEDLTKLFPSLTTADQHIVQRLNGRNIKVGVGVHDSSAALMPYLVSVGQPFLLLSSGTWNITFNPFNNSPLTQEELDKDCLSYITYDGKPVKASRIFLGHEHEAQKDLLAKHFHVDPDYYKSVMFDEAIYKKLATENPNTKVFYPVSMAGTGPIPEESALKTDLSVFQNFEEAYHQLVRYLLKWQKISIDLVDPLAKIKNLIIVGGFTKSSIFLKILALELPERNVMISDHPRASALGAAWLVNGKAHYQQNLLNLKKIE